MTLVKSTGGRVSTPALPPLTPLTLIDLIGAVVVDVSYKHLTLEFRKDGRRYRVRVVFLIRERHTDNGCECAGRLSFHKPVEVDE